MACQGDEQMKDLGKSDLEIGSCHGKFDRYDYRDFRPNHIERTTKEEWLAKGKRTNDLGKSGVETLCPSRQSRSL